VYVPGAAKVCTLTKAAENTPGLQSVCFAGYEACVPSPKSNVALTGDADNVVAVNVNVRFAGCGPRDTSSVALRVSGVGSGVGGVCVRGGVDGPGGVDGVVGAGALLHAEKHITSAVVNESAINRVTVASSRYRPTLPS
jgi:hypothetical protein